MQLLIKRLELIKTAIDIEDEEIIHLQLEKFDVSSCDDEIKDILLKVKNKDYGDVAVLIDEYLKRYSGVMVYEDKELQGLKFELKALEKKLQDIGAEKNRYLDEIRMFNVRYHLTLGEIIKKILEAKERFYFQAFEEQRREFEEAKDEYEDIKQEYQDIKTKKEQKEKELEELDEFDDRYDECYEEYQELKSKLNEAEERLNEKRKEAKKAKEKLDEDENSKEYEESKKDSSEFNKEYEEVKNKDRYELSEEELKELKSLYRKSAMLCHPDIVADEFKEEAVKVFHQLNEANEKQDLEAIKEIYANLKTHGFSFTSDSTDDKELLRDKIANLRKNIQENENEIERIKEDESYKILQENEDIDEYLEGLKTKLQQEYENILNKLVKKEEEAPKPKDDEEDYWESEF